MRNRVNGIIRFTIDQNIKIRICYGAEPSSFVFITINNRSQVILDVWQSYFESNVYLYMVRYVNE